MPSVELQETVAASSEEVVRSISDAVLTPIPGDRPAGTDSRTGKLWVELMKARPRQAVPSGGIDAAVLEPAAADWGKYRDALENALCTTTKDLELGLFLAEASARVHGFNGLRDAFWMLGGLISGYLHSGLHPQWDGDLSAQGEKLYWLSEKLPDVISEIPLTRRPEPGPNFSLNFFNESLRQGGMITSAQFDEAAAAGTVDEYMALVAFIVEAKAELLRFKAIANDAYGEATPSFSAPEACLDRCCAVVKGILSKREARSNATSPGAKSGPPAPTKQAALSKESAVLPEDAWSACETMAQSGNVDGAIAAMAGLSVRDPNGRVRFHRKLMLADLCLRTNRKKLGASILEELNEIIERHNLENWESSEIVGGVWTRLVRCYRDKAAGTHDSGKEAEFFLKLSRLDPWQAVACGEPKKEE